MMRWTILLFIFSSWQLAAQNLDQIKIDKPNVYLDGSLSLGVRSFGSSRPSINNNSSFGYLANARLNLHVYDFSLPFSYRLGDQLNLPSLPSFKYWGLSPKYKALQLHLGHRSIRFSDHTLAGIQTFGYGFAINTKGFQLQLSRGTLDRQRPERVIYNTRVLQRKEKKYTAGSIRIGSSNNYLKYALLSAKEAQGLADSIPARTNLVNELTFKRQLGKVVFIKSNVALSYVDSNEEDFITLSDTSSSLAVKSVELLGNAPDAGSKIGLLYGASIGVQSKGFSLSLDFDHIDRSFETFGRNFQITDVRTYTVKNRFQLLKNKLMVNSRVGLQQNNLQDDKANNSTRWITNVNITGRSDAGHIISAHISNFNLEKENLYVVGQDSFSFSFNALTIGVSPQLQFGNSRLIGNFTMTKNINERLDEANSIGQKLQLASVTYEIPLADNDNMIILGANYSKLSADFLNDKLYGVTMGVQLIRRDKLQFRFQYNPNINNTQSEDHFLTHVLNLNTQYIIGKQQSLYLSAYYQKLGGIQAIRDNQIRIGYTWKFNTSKKNTNL